MTTLLTQHKNDITDDISALLNPVRDDITKLNERLDANERIIRKNNIVIRGIKEESNENYAQLEEIVLILLVNELKIEINANNIDYVRRLGRHSSNRARPILVRFVSFRYKRLVLSNKRILFSKKIYIEEDFSINELKKRRELVIKMKQAREEGKYSVIKGLKLIIEEWREPKGNKKRPVGSPEQSLPPTQRKKPDIRSYTKTNKN